MFVGLDRTLKKFCKYRVRWFKKRKSLIYTFIKIYLQLFLWAWELIVFCLWCYYALAYLIYYVLKKIVLFPFKLLFPKKDLEQTVTSTNVNTDTQSQQPQINVQESKQHKNKFYKIKKLFHRGSK